MTTETDIEKAIERLQELQELEDPERAHREADEILLEFAPDEVAEEYQKIQKWYA